MPPFAPKGIPPDWQEMPESYWELLGELGLEVEVPRRCAIVGAGRELWFYPPGVRELLHAWLVLDKEERVAAELEQQVRQAVWNDRLMQRRRNRTT